jgi:hypothetical protein
MHKGISVAARKNKGRALQQKVRDLILATFPSLELDDVRSTSMGMGGEDLQLSPAARRRFPYSVECKRNKAFAIYGPYEQATANCMGYEPIVVIQGDRKKPLVVLDLDHFMTLVQKGSPV